MVTGGGVFYSMRAEIPAMLAAGGGAIVNMASILGSVGVRPRGRLRGRHARRSGHDQDGRDRVCAAGLRINSVGPGFIDTPLLAAAGSDVIAGVSALHPSGRLGRSPEVAELVAFLASDKASNTTGSYFLTDGGYTAQ